MENSDPQFKTYDILYLYGVFITPADIKAAIERLKSIYGSAKFHLEQAKLAVGNGNFMSANIDEIERSVFWIEDYLKRRAIPSASKSKKLYSKAINADDGDRAIIIAKFAKSATTVLDACSRAARFHDKVVKGRLDVESHFVSFKRTLSLVCTSKIVEP